MQKVISLYTFSVVFSALFFLNRPPDLFFSPLCTPPSSRLSARCQKISFAEIPVKKSTSASPFCLYLIELSIYVKYFHFSSLFETKEDCIHSGKGDKKVEPVGSISPVRRILHRAERPTPDSPSPPQKICKFFVYIYSSFIHFPPEKAYAYRAIILSLKKGENTSRWNDSV